MDERQNREIGAEERRYAETLYPSVTTSKPAISYHFKTGQRNHTQDQMMFYRAGGHSGKCFCYGNLAKGRAFDLTFPNSPRKRKVEEGNAAE